jgi:hypothetical protein
VAVCKLFDERPVWPRQSLYERLQEDGVHVSQNQFKRFNYSLTLLVELPYHLVPLLCLSVVIFFAHMPFFFVCSGFCLELDTTSLLDPLVNSGSEEDMTLVKTLTHECKQHLHC